MRLTAATATLMFSFFALGPSVIGQQLSDPSLVLKAHKFTMSWQTEWNKNDISFQTSAENAEIATGVNSTGLFRHYTYTTNAAHADLIFVIDDDALSGTVTLKVLNPDDNSAVYTESRDRVAVDNDVKRLVEHFLKAVDDARDAQTSKVTRDDGDSQSLPQPSDTSHSYDACKTSVSPAQFAALTGQSEAICDAQSPENPAPASGDLPTNSPDHSSTAPQPTCSVSRGDGPSYLWIARYDQEDRAQDASRKIQGLGLTSVVIPQSVENGKRAYVVFSGPFPPTRIPSVIDWLRSQGFTNVCEIKPPKIPSTP